jgi:hypothetical protein
LKATVDERSRQPWSGTEAGALDWRAVAAVAPRNRHSNRTRRTEPSAQESASGFT